MGEIVINGPKVLWEIPILGGLPITETMRNAWIIMAAIFALCLFLTSGLSKMPKGKQALVEKAIEVIDGMVDQTMGEGCRDYAPYITTLLLFSFMGSMASLFFMRPVTGDLNTTLGWAIITFALIIYNNIRFKGLGGYIKGFFQPVVLMAPLNVLGELAIPVSMSFRHFGNIAGGLVITTLMMGALKALSGLILGFLPIPLLQIGLPGVLSLYFDVFTSAMQAFIFAMLTMSYVGNARSVD